MSLVHEPWKHVVPSKANYRQVISPLLPMTYWRVSSRQVSRFRKSLIWSDWLRAFQIVSTWNALSQSFSHSRLFNQPHWGFSESTDLIWRNPSILNFTKPNPTFLGRATLRGYNLYREIFYSIPSWYKSCGEYCCMVNAWQLNHANHNWIVTSFSYLANIHMLT